MDLSRLHARSRGRADLRVAVLDGTADLTHPCFAGASLERLPSLVDEAAQADGPMSQHGTHVASLVFGQPGSAVLGVVPDCHGLIIPVLSDTPGRSTSQLDLVRALRTALDAGAHIINISAGEFGDERSATDLLAQTIIECHERGVLIVAAAGNHGCPCLQVPAALPGVLAVGACDDQGRPIDMSNWGSTYASSGILAPGQDILGAVPGGGTARATGTSFATPLVAGFAALLASVQLDAGRPLDLAAVRAAILASARSCPDPEPTRCLIGVLDPEAALARLDRDNPMDIDIHPDTDHPSAAPPNSTASVESPGCRSCASEAQNPIRQAPVGQHIYALGVLGYDFGTEARRDSFKQLMPATTWEGTQVPANPYDARQMVDYLGASLSEARSLIWTLNLELTPIYALVPSGPFAHDVYQQLQRMLDGQIQAEDLAAYVERVSIPGRLTDRSVRLFSGQVVPVVELEHTRGMYGWNVNALRDAAINAVKAKTPDASEAAARRSLSSFLNRVYYELRNLGQSSAERAMNFAATNAFQVATAFADAVGAGMELDGIEVKRSPFCRMDSDCWDVVLSFFDAENVLRARKLFRFTIDVSDSIPVTMGEVRSWSSR